MIFKTRFFVFLHLEVICLQKLYFLTSKCKKNEKWYCPHPDLNPGSSEWENSALDHLAIETIYNNGDILSNKYSFYFKGQFLRPRYAWVLGGIFFLIHLFNLLYAKPSGNSTHIVPTCNISRIFACFLSSCLIVPTQKWYFGYPKFGLWVFEMQKLIEIHACLLP